MIKHLFIISAIFSMACFVGSIIGNEESFTILGWFTACISGLTVVLLEHSKELNKDEE